MALNFPNSPALNDIYTDSVSGFSYRWNGVVWISFSAASSSQIKTLDDISASFNNSTLTFALTSGSVSITPPTSQSLIINLGGVIQDATDDYSVSGSNITFSTAPTNGLSFSGVSLGPAVPVDYANNGNVYTRTTFTATASQTTFTVTGTYTVGYLEVYQNGVRLSAGTDYTATTGTTFVLTTPANLSDEIESIGYNVASIVTTTGQFDNLSISGVSIFVGLATHTGTIFGSNLSLTGIVTATSFVGSGANLTGIANTANIVSTAITTGILNVGTGITINSSGINVTGITTIKNASGTVTIGIGTTALLVEGNARVTGILTVGSSSITLNGITDIINVGTGVTINGTTGTISATSFSGDGSGLTGVGIGSTGSINTSGIITATSFVGNGSGLTGVGIGSTGSINTSGIITATSFVGALTGNATGLSGSPNITVGVLTATRLDVPPIPITFSPGVGATGVSLNSNIIITFNGTVAKGTGNITLRANSAGGTAFSTIGVSSSSVTISGGAVTIDPPANIGFAVTTFVVVDAGAFSGLTTTTTNDIINTYSFTTIDVAPGDSYEGGFLICKASPLRWVVSPYSAEVSRNWYLREDANTRSQQVSGCTGWFVPTCGQLQNPGYCCRSFWGPSPCYSSTVYWSSTEGTANNAYGVAFNGGNAGTIAKTTTACVRAFRCVTY